MQAGRTTIVRTDPATQFIGALAQNAAETANLVQGSDIGQVDGSISAGYSVNGLIVAALILSVENLAWEVMVWGKDTYNTPTDYADLFPLGQWAFAAGDGLRTGGAGPYYYYIDGLAIPVVDLDRTGELHLMLINRSAGAKTAGAAGALLLQLFIEPTTGW